MQIIQPNTFSNPQQRHGGLLDIQRPPIQHTCPRCQRRNLVVLPNAEGVCVWRCTCSAEHRLDFKPWDGQIGFEGNFALQRKPLNFGCECGRTDIIVLPAGYGDMRFTCPHCKDINGIRFNHQGGSIYKVSTCATRPDTIDD